MSTTATEQAIILGLMCEIKKLLPVDALMETLEDVKTSSIFLSMDVAHTRRSGVCGRSM